MKKQLYSVLFSIGVISGSLGVFAQDSGRNDVVEIKLCFVKDSAGSIHKRFNYTLSFPGSEVDSGLKYEIVAEERGGVVWPQNQQLGRYGDIDSGQLVISAGWPARIRVVATDANFRRAFDDAMKGRGGFLESPTGMYRVSKACTLNQSGLVSPEDCSRPDC